MKGHLQTWLVLMRDPARTAREMGLGAFFLMQITLGGSLLSSLLHAWLIVWLAVGALTSLVELQGWHGVLFGVGYGAVLASAHAARVRRMPVITLLTLPLYWPLASLAMLRALLDMKLRPQFWAKTPHGLTRSKPMFTPAPDDNVVQLEFPFAGTA